MYIFVYLMYKYIHMCKMVFLDIPYDSLYPEMGHFTKFTCVIVPFNISVIVTH